MECITCTTGGLQNKRSNEFNYRLTNRYLAVRKENFCHQCKRIGNAVDKIDHLESEKHETITKNLIL